MATRTTAFQPRRVLDALEWGTLAKMEAAYGTSLAVAETQTHYPFKGEAVLIDRGVGFESDADEVGVQTEWEENLYEINRNPVISGLGYRMSAEMCAILFSLALGKRSETVQQTDKYYEVKTECFTRSDALAAGTAGNNQAASTSLHAKSGPNEYMIDGVVVNALNIEANVGKVADMTCDLLCSGFTAEGPTAFQAAATPNHLKLTAVSVDGDVVTDGIIGVTFGYTNNIVEDARHTAGGGVDPSRALIGARREVSLKLVQYQHSTDTELADYLARTDIGAIQLLFEGAAISGSSPAVNHSLTIDLFAGWYNGLTEGAANGYGTNEMEILVGTDGTDFIDATIAINQNGYMTLDS